MKPLRHETLLLLPIHYTEKTRQNRSTNKPNISQSVKMKAAPLPERSPLLSAALNPL